MIDISLTYILGTNYLDSLSFSTTFDMSEWRNIIYIYII